MYTECYTPSNTQGEDETRLLQRYAPLVKRVARQLSDQANCVFGREDMEQLGLMALLDCLRRYGEPDVGFTGFALLRIRGAILDELRKLDWRPRSVRQDVHRLRDGLRALRRTLTREPTKAEVMQAFGMSEEVYHAVLQAENAEVLASFDELLSAGIEPGQAEGPETRLVLQNALAHALATLTEREQRVIQMYYEFELSFKEIAVILDVTAARICQINKSALKKMQTCLTAN